MRGQVMNVILTDMAKHTMLRLKIKTKAAWEIGQEHKIYV